MKKLTNAEVMEIINRDLFYAIDATENSYRNKFYVLVNGERIEGFAKTKRGAEGSIKRRTFSYYDEYSMEMVQAGANLEVYELSALDIVDYYNDLTIWYNTMFNRWQIRQSNDYMLTKARELNVSNNIIVMIENILSNSDSHSHPSKEMVGIVEELQQPALTEEANEKEVTECDTSTQETKTVPADVGQDNENASVQMVLNKEKNGVELYFDDIPSDEIRNRLKSNGFRWSSYNKCWYAKQLESRLELAKELSAGNIVDKKPTEPTVIELESFVDYSHFSISEHIENALNMGTNYPREKGGYTTVMQEGFKKGYEIVSNLIDTTDNKYIKNRIIRAFNRYVNNYYKAYLTYLTQKSQSPSWTVTGRSGMNMHKYHLKQDRINKQMNQCSDISKAFEEEVQKCRSLIREDKKKKLEQTINSVETLVKFEARKHSIEQLGMLFHGRAYFADNYFIMKTWGAFRVFDVLTQKELYVCKTTDNLDVAKKYVTLLIQKESNLTVAN